MGDDVDGYVIIRQLLDTLLKLDVLKWDVGYHLSTSRLFLYLDYLLKPWHAS
jgi:hypothetical protein